MNYLYLHGFASGPQSRKAQYLCDRFHSADLTLQIPDLNQEDFYSLTLSRQIQQVQQILTTGPWTLIGSSFGGLTAAWVAQIQPQVQQLILLAPAFGFLDHWLPILGEVKLQEWQTKGILEVYHYAAQQDLPLSYGFIEDLRQYRDSELQRPVPTLIFHGLEDEIIPIVASQQFSAQRPWVTLKALESNHALANVLFQLWANIGSLLGLSLPQQ